jgi:uncharacterized protein (TIGR00730 family)
MMGRTIKRVCVYCGSSDKIRSRYLVMAGEMGRALIRRDMQLVFGGGGTGMMGSLADAVLEGGGHVIGVVPESFNTPQLVHHGLSDLRIVRTMHERKARMVEISDAFVALPGGFGTLEELFEILTWAQVGLHKKPVGVLDMDDYFDPIFKWIEQARREGFIYDEHRTLLLRDSNPDKLLNRLVTYISPEGLERWVDRQEDGR